MNTYLSIVVTARNDNYGGQLLQRMQASIDSIIKLGERAGLDSELLIVEWNPPEDEPSLATSLEIPENTDHVSVRIIQVPSEVHHSIPNAENIPLFEYIAKNTGIRRAKGSFVLATNPDLVYNSELVEFLASRNLNDNYFYRIHRYDIDQPVPLSLSVDERLEFAKQHLYQISTSSARYLDTEASLVTRTADRIRSVARTIRDERRTLAKKLLKPAELFEAFSHVLELPTAQQRKTVDKNLEEAVVVTPDALGKSGLFLTSSGDFLLMSRDAWHDVRGYPELSTNTHVDSLGCVQANRYGLSQAVLKDPLRIYHQEHDRVEQKSRPMMDAAERRRKEDRLFGASRFKPYNDESWGLGEEGIDRKINHIR